jgi:hypothetical protein
MMKNALSHRLHHNGLLLALLAASVGATIVTAACSSSNGGGGFQNSPDSSTGGGGGGTSDAAGACANPTVGITFSPMYSAYIPGSTAQVFAIPAITDDGNTATWSLSDPSQGTLQAQMFTNGSDQLPGVMITIAGTGDSNGDVTVIANESGGACGSAVLHITTNAESDWTIGNERYNDGVSIHLPGYSGDGGRPEGGFGHHDGGGGGGGGGGGFGGGDSGSYFESEGGTACTNCHGPMATNGVYNDVSHTPEQTGGFSDTDLAGIILDGVVPDGGYFDPTVINPNCDGGAQCTAAAYARWHSFHQWTDITSDQLPGIICYLRSLTPAPQNGMSNFGGGGGHHHDGGFGPPPGDASTAGD